MPARLRNRRFGLDDDINLAKRHDVILYQVSFEENTNKQVYNAKSSLTAADIEF